MCLIVQHCFSSIWRDTSAKRLAKQVNIITREWWRARNPLRLPPPLLPPITDVYCCFSGTPSCDNSRKCSQIVKHLQKFHMYTKKMHDIQYRWARSGWEQKSDSFSLQYRFLYIWSTLFVAIIVKWLPIENWFKIHLMNMFLNR